MQRELTITEAQDLLSRNFSLHAKVLAHQVIVETGQWDQGGLALNNLPIPTRGLRVKDDKFGTVLIFPDSSGRLHYNADLAATSQAVAETTVLPIYHSPSDNGLHLFGDIQAALTGWALLALAVYIGVKLVEKHV